MLATAVEFVTAKWATLTSMGKTCFLIGLAVGVVVRSIL